MNIKGIIIFKMVTVKSAVENDWLLNDVNEGYKSHIHMTRRRACLKNKLVLPVEGTFISAKFYVEQFGG